MGSFDLILKLNDEGFIDDFFLYEFIFLIFLEII